VSNTERVKGKNHHKVGAERKRKEKKLDDRNGQRGSAGKNIHLFGIGIRNGSMATGNGRKKWR